MLNHDIEIRAVDGERQHSPASNSSPSPFSREQLPPSVSIGKPWWLAAGFLNLHTWLPFPVRDSAVHEPSAVTSQWAIKRCQPSQSLIDTHEKALLVVLLTQDIIRRLYISLKRTWQSLESITVNKATLM